MEPLFNAGLLCLINRQYSEAYLYFSLYAEKNESPAAFFNLAVCAFRGGDYAEAENCLEKAMRAIPPPKIGNSQTEKTELFQKLQQADAESDSYRQAMSRETPLQFPRIAKHRILRLMIDIAVVTEQWNKVTQLASSLQGMNYRNVTEAINSACTYRRESEI